MRGFTLIEALLAMMITAVVAAPLLQLLEQAQSVLQPQLDVADLQQRLRVAVNVIASDIRMAGAGKTVGPDAGPLSNSTAPVMPYRRGALNDDPSANVFYRPDTLTVLYIPSTATQTNIVSHTYYLKADNASAAFQLMQYNGGSGDFPLIDNVVHLSFEYFGRGQAPVGIRPPAEDIDFDLSDEYGAGENCLFVNGETGVVPRLPDLGPGLAPVALEASSFTDGPWCPNMASPARFDADLLRISRVRVRLRLQVGQAALRGPVGVLFARGGTATRALRTVPDREIGFDVALRNLSAGQ